MSTDAEYIKEIEEALEEGLEVARSTDGWKEEKQDKKTGDIVESKKIGKGRKVYRCKAKVKMTVKALADLIKDCDTVTKWNQTLTESRTLKKLTDDTMISYQVTSEGGGGLVSARDFVYGSKAKYIDGPHGEIFVMGGKSVDFPDAPKNSKLVRAINGPGCQMVLPVEGNKDMAEFMWYMDCEYKGWIPQSILDVAMPIAQTQFIDCIRKYADSHDDL